MTKSGKSTDSFTYLGRSYRFFAEIRLVLTRVLSPNFASLKTPPCLSKFAQTWREKPANSSDMVRFSGKSFRLGGKIRLHKSVHKTNLEIRVTYRKVRLKSAKNLYLGHRFFDKIRQIHRFFDVIRQKLQILCRNQAHPSVHLVRASSHRPPGEKPRPLAALSHKKPGIHTKWIPGRNRLQPASAPYLKYSTPPSMRGWNWSPAVSSGMFL